MLLAPGSGQETRDRLVRQARRLRQAAEDTIDGWQEHWDRLTGDEEEGDGEDADEGWEDGDEEAGEEEERSVAEDLEEDEGEGEATPRRTGSGGARVSEARRELERRLAAARARRRSRAVEDEEPVA